MTVVITILMVLLVIVSIGMVVLVMLQEGNERGLSSSIAGGFSDSYAARNQGRTKEGRLKLYTRIGLIAFLVLALAINILQSLA